AAAAAVVAPPLVLLRFGPNLALPDHIIDSPFVVVLFEVVGERIAAFHVGIVGELSELAVGEIARSAFRVVAGGVLFVWVPAGRAVVAEVLRLSKLNENCGPWGHARVGFVRLRGVFLRAGFVRPPAALLLGRFGGTVGRTAGGVPVVAAASAFVVAAFATFTAVASVASPVGGVGGFAGLEELNRVGGVGLAGSVVAGTNFKVQVCAGGGSCTGVACVAAGFGDKVSGADLLA